MRKSSLAVSAFLRHGRASLIGLTMAAGLTVGPVVAQGVDPAPPADFVQGADALHPGQFIWTPGVAPTGQMAIYVDLSRQVAAVYRGGARIGVTTISSGREGYETPTGVFRIMSKDANHHSNRYDNAPMPFSERLTDDGVALHAGRVPGYPESHGCVHLPYGFAKALFSETRVGVTVVVMNGDLPDSAQASSQIASDVAAPSPLDAMTHASPEPSSDGALTRISSTRD